MNLLKHAIWAMALAASVMTIAIETRKYDVGEIQQRAFMMKACIDAGGQWERGGWSPDYRCIRISGKGQP